MLYEVITHDLPAHNYILHIFIRKSSRIKKICLVVIVEHNPHLLLMPEVVNNKVMSYPHHPRDKFPVILITSGAY